jgi:hypothetical protein
VESQVSALFRGEAQAARLPINTWSAIEPRMGEPDSPGILWMLRSLWPGMPFRQTGIARYVAPAATVALVALAIALFVLFLNNDDDSNGPAPAGSPTPQDQATPAPSPKLTREQAMALAEDALRVGDGAATAVEDPHDMVTRLMRVRDIHGAESLPAYATRRDTLVWLVQVEGESHTAQRGMVEDKTYRFNAVAVDAVTGDVVARMQSEYEPFLLPRELLPEELVNAGIDERDIQRDALPVTRDEAVRIATEQYGAPEGANAIEVALVRYSNPSAPGADSIGPSPTPTPASASGPSPTANSDGRELFVPNPFPQATATPISDRLSWLVIMPTDFGFSGCPISGPGPTGDSEEFARVTCWVRIQFVYVDADTGVIYEGGSKGVLGPSLTSEERAALNRFAWAEGWWALWHEVRQYNGQQRLPEGLAAQLDRPDAPTPTPYPPTATPPADATPTATPTPPPSATPAPTATPAPMRVVRVDSFGSPVSGTVFEELLARMPDNELTRQMLDLSDIAGPNELYGLEPPLSGAGVDEEAYIAYGERLNDLYMQGFPVDIRVWPTELRRYVNQLNWYPYLAFDLWSVTQSAAVMSDGGPAYQYDIAFGQFDPQATANALAVCGCDQPDIRDRNGIEFYSWGEEFIGDINKRFDPPMYDHVGRGPRLLVLDGEAYYSISDEAMLNMIDVVNGDAPSLADDEDYLLTAQWLAMLGNMATMSFSSSPLSLNASGYNYEEAIRSAPLLRDFDTVASGLGHDGERLFAGIVIANPDEATAEANADLLEQRLREGLTGLGDDTWEEYFELAEISVEGRFNVAKLYLRTSRIDQRFAASLVQYTLAVSE